MSSLVPEGGYDIPLYETFLMIGVRETSELCNPKQWKTISNSDLLKRLQVFEQMDLSVYHEFNHEAKLFGHMQRSTCGTVNLIHSNIYHWIRCSGYLSREVSKFYLFYATHIQDILRRN